MEIRSRVGVASRCACFRSQTARTPSGSKASSAGPSALADLPATNSQAKQTMLLLIHVASSRFMIASIR